jgi:putative peptide zinc metalloprotease protein
MNASRFRLIRWVTAAFLAAALCLATAPAATADEKTNEATAVNTEDGSSVFRFALSIRDVANGVVDQTNTATAEASCVDCATVAVAFQVILVSNAADVVVPENKAVATNTECSECFTYATATQLVIGTDGKELSDNGKRRLLALEKRMREVERNANEMTEAQLFAVVQQAKAELIRIFEEELVPIKSKKDTEDGSGPTSTSSTSTTVRSTTTTTTAPAETTTTEAA